MRIVIEIEDTEIAAKNSQVSVQAKLPHGDMSEKAASSGAQDAGAAPTQNMGMGSETSPRSSETNPPGGAAPATDGDSGNAGAAPQLSSVQ
jgi:hypothetical protein